MKDDLEILLYGDSQLREKAQPVEAFDDSVRDLVNRMARAMLDHDGIGLAAPQVGVQQRIIMAVRNARPSEGVLTLINPVIEEVGRQEDSFREGCLSLPGIFEDVRRPVRAKVSYQDLDGGSHLLEDDGILARIIQHEADHLEGILMVDHLSLLKRKLLSKKLKKLARGDRS